LGKEEAAGGSSPKGPLAVLKRGMPFLYPKNSSERGSKPRETKGNVPVQDHKVNRITWGKKGERWRWGISV